jgi:acetolactate synthase-1/2/3 large subunit
MKVSDYIVRHLAAQGVTHAFTLAGGMLGHLIDSFATVEGAPRLISCHHEQGAGFAAEGAARMTGVPGVALGTSGPGATNLLTAIGSCYFDSVPAVFITGSVNRDEMKGERPVRQLGFQETDVVAMAKPITKVAGRIDSPGEMLEDLNIAFEVARSGRPGPVLLDIPLDVQGAELDLPDPKPVGWLTPGICLGAPAEIDALHAALVHANRPLVLVGGGATKNRRRVRAALERLGVPVVYSLMGVDVPPPSLRVGLIGSYGNRWANAAVAESDFLLVLGSRLDIRQTGTDVKGFGQRQIIHVDVDSGELAACRVAGARNVVSDVESYASAILERTPITMPAWEPWRERIAKLHSQWPAIFECNAPGINPNDFMRLLGISSSRAGAFVVDVGQHQMWAAQSLSPQGWQRFLTSGGMGAMGFALPAAIGAYLATGDQVVVIAGDGGMQVNIQELETIRRHNLPIKIVVMNNRSLGMVRQFQDSYFGGRQNTTVDGYSAPSFMRVAEAYGIRSRLIDERWIPDALEWLWSDNLPALLEVTISPKANAYPKLAWGKGLADMEPIAKSLPGEGT